MANRLRSALAPLRGSMAASSAGASSAPRLAAAAPSLARGYANPAETYNMTQFGKHEWEDPLQVNGLLNDEETAISETARAFCQETLQPKVKEMYRNETWDPTILPALGALGLLGPTIQGYDCAGVNNVSYGLITRELERVDSGYRSMMSVQSSLSMGAINQFGTEEQKSRWLPGMAKGKIVGCFGLTEPNHGSDPSGMETVAEDTGDGEIILNGSKTWISNSPHAQVAVVWARCKWDNKVRGFIVPTDAPGMSCPPIKNKLMLRASVTGSIFLDNVRVKRDESLLSRAKPGLVGALTCLSSARYGIAFGSMGALEACIAEARQYAIDRKQFGKPLAATQLIQNKLADASTEAALGLLGAVQLGRAKDSGAWTPEMVSMMKRNNCSKALQHSRTLLEILGGNATSDEYNLGRHAQNLHVVYTYEGTHDIHGLILGKSITGEQAFY